MRRAAAPHRLRRPPQNREHPTQHPLRQLLLLPPARTRPTGKIGVIQLTEHVALDAARDGFIDALVEAGFNRENIDVQNAQGEIPNCATIATKFVNDKVDLILAVATPAAQAAAPATTEIPILATAVTDFVSAGLVNSDEVPGGNVSGTSDMNPIEEQADLLVKLVPEAKTVGILYCSAEDNSILQAGLAKAAFEARGLTVNEYTAADVNNTARHHKGCRRGRRTVHSHRQSVCRKHAHCSVLEVAKLPSSARYSGYGRHGLRLLASTTIILVNWLLLRR